MIKSFSHSPVDCCLFVLSNRLRIQELKGNLCKWHGILFMAIVLHVQIHFDFIFPAWKTIFAACSNREMKGKGGKQNLTYAFTFTYIHYMIRYAMFHKATNVFGCEQL